MNSVQLQISRAATVLAWLSSITTLALAQSDLPKLLGQLSDRTLDRSVLFQIEAQPSDPRVTPALESAFEARSSKEEKQWLAVSLIRVGDTNSAYFQFLVGYARQAIEDRTPFFMKFDAEGRSVRAQMDEGFLNWCADNGKDPKAIGAIQAGTYPVDVMYLAEAQDARAGALLRQGLGSPNILMLPWVVAGLARLQDTESLPLIERALMALPAEARIAPSAQLAWYSQPEASQLMGRLIPNAPQREFWRRQVAQHRDIELQRTLKRQGRAPIQ